MSYRLDFRKQVLSYVANGHTKTEAAREFRIARACIYNWLDRPNLAPATTRRRRHKPDSTALRSAP